MLWSTTGTGRATVQWGIRGGQTGAQIHVVRTASARQPQKHRQTCLTPREAGIGAGGGIGIAFLLACRKRSA